MLGRLLLPEIEELVARKDFRNLKEVLAELPAVDLAEMISDLEESDLVVVFRLLSKDVATEVFEYLEFPQQAALLEKLKSETIRHILEEMSPDDRTALLEDLPAIAASRLMTMLSPEERQIAQTLLNYPEESVGRLMTPDFIYLRPQMTIEDALAKIRRLGIDRETVYALYVVDKHQKLLGTVSLRKLVSAPLDLVIEDMMEENVIKIEATADQEEAAEMLRHYDLIALPVVDSDSKLLGIITFDDMMDIIEAEYTEDAQMQAAIIPVEDSYLTARVLDLAKSRVVWLVALLLAETVGVFLLKGAQDFLNTTIVLALFIPIMVATGGNTGTQSAALVIRALATGEVELSDTLKILMREIGVSFLLATILGLLAFNIVLYLESSVVLGVCIGIGLATIVTMSNLIGTLLPLVLEKMGLDPALMSGPFISTLIDVAGLFIYVHISMHILARWG